MLSMRTMTLYKRCVDGGAVAAFSVDIAALIGVVPRTVGTMMKGKKRRKMSLLLLLLLLF